MDFYKKNDIRQAIEAKRRLEEQIGRPLRELQDYGRIINREQISVLDQFRDYQREKAIEALQAASQRLTREITQGLNAKDALNHQVRMQLFHWQDKLNEHPATVGNQKELLRSFQAASTLMAESERLSQSITRLKLDTVIPSLAERILSPAIYYSAYTRRAIQRLVELKDANKQAVLERALDLAEAEFSEQSEFIESILDHDITYEGPSSPIHYNLYEEQERELIGLEEGQLDAQAESQIPPLSQVNSKEIFGLWQETGKLWITCNQQSQVNKGRDIFKLTNSVIEAFIDLPYLIVKNKETLVQFIAHLYRVIYEAAGDKNLRFLKENGGWFEREECEAIWILKNLRNKLLLHDPEHGSESDIQGNYAVLAKALKELALPGLPAKEVEFTALQKAVLSKLRDFLANLVEKMRV